MILVIEHNNGINNKHGFSIETISDTLKIVSVLKNYEKANCTVYNHYVEEEENA